AFDLAPLALALYRDLGIHVQHAVDIQSISSNGPRKTPSEAIELIIGEDPDIRVNVENIRTAFDLAYYDSDPKSIRRTNLVQRTWISQYLAGCENFAEQFNDVPRIDTTSQRISDKKLDILSKLASDALRLEHMKPSKIEHTAQVTEKGAGVFNAQSSIYKRKLRRDQSMVLQEIHLTVQNSNGTFTLPAQTAGARGRNAILSLGREINTQSNQILGSIISNGDVGSTNTEEKRNVVLLKTLQGQTGTIFDNPWFINIWEPLNGNMVWPKSHSFCVPKSRFLSVPELPERPLNESQILAIQRMLSFKDEDHIILIRGPPGSGKTSVISRFVEIATASQDFPGIWLVAQSNIAVKNIAEKLAKVGFMGWKLLVSTDFYLDWHEHIYDSAFQSNLLQSEQFYQLSPSKLQRYLKGCKVILCTLSMLSSSQLPKFLRNIPMHTLVVDEASQIEIGNFLPVLTSCGGRLKKLCLIGDDKQLPPHGQEEIQDLQSIFEIEHFHAHLYLLDTQYRMPPQMGEFISSAVYEGALRSNPKHAIADHVIACWFIEASGTESEMNNGSFINEAEAVAVIQLAEVLEKSGRNYRIVTPYDSQRNHIEKLMKENEQVTWENRCFNVDSFQGNEEDYIIISTVRSYRPGFL
ncbi:P-loop containing nucleoside triphosphate hydrolase protein, partial [Lentinula raphanica]